jgi:hypothetical protein
MKAILKNGMIHPKEPVPADWSEGTELEVEKAGCVGAGATGDELDRWHGELEDACSQMDPEDDRILKEAILEVRRAEKALARKQAVVEG